MSFILLIISLAIKPLRSKKTAPTIFLCITAACIVSFINYNKNIVPVQKYEGQECTITAKITDLPHKSNNRYYYTIDVTAINKNDIRNFKTRMYSSKPLECDLYDEITCKVNFYLPYSGYYFDSESYFKSKQIYILASCKDPDSAKVKQNEKYDLYYYIIRLRQKMLSIPQKFFSNEIAAVQNGIILGEKTNISENTKINLQKNGCYHLVVTSGIHISILMTISLWIFKKLKFNESFSQILTTIFIFAFMALAGFSPSVMRSGTMSIIYLIGLAISKKAVRINSLGASILIICTINPGASLDIGLWLSVLSILGIIIFNDKIKNFIHSKLKKNISKNKIIRYLIASISLSLSVSVFTTPIICLIMGIIPLTYVIFNIIFIPLGSLILTTSLILSVMGVVGLPGFLMYPVAYVSGMLTKIFIEISSETAKIPLCYIYMKYPFLKFWFAMSAFLTAICVLFIKSKKRIIYCSLISINLMIAGVLSYQVLNFDALNIRTISCGNGLGIVISENNRRCTLLCGSENTSTRDLNYYVNCSNISKLDYLWVPYYSDDCDNFINDTIKSDLVKSVFLPKDSDLKLPETKGIKTLYFNEKAKLFVWNDLSFEYQKINDHIYIYIKARDKSIILIPNGGDVDEIPTNKLRTDILISYGLPNNFEKINFDKVILYGPRGIIDPCIKVVPNNTAYNLRYYGNLDINIKNDKIKMGV